MAFEYQGFATLGVNLNRQKYGPLDISNVFTSEADLKYYLSKGTYTEGVSEYWTKVVPYPYEGQVLATAIDGDVKVYVLRLDTSGAFEAKAIEPEVDNKTIKLTDGKLELVGLPTNTTGKTYVPSYVNGVLTWSEPDTTTVEGQNQEIAALKLRADALEATVNGTDKADGLVDQVADEIEAREAADEVLEGKIAEALQAAKDYADAQDTDTVYDDSDLQTRVAAIEADYLKTADKYNDTDLKTRIKTAEDDIDALEIAVGDENTGLVKAVSDNADAIQANTNAISALDTAYKAADSEALASAKSYTDTEISGLTVAIEKKNNVEHIVVKNKAGAEVASVDASKFVQDSFLDDVAYNAETGKVSFTWYMGDGSTKTDEIDIAHLVDTYTAGTGLTLKDNEFAVDTSVIATAEALAGVSAVANAAQTASQVSTAISNAFAEANLAQYAVKTAVDSALEGKVDAATYNADKETFAVKADIEENYYTAAEVDAKGYAVAATVDATYATKTVVAGIEADVASLTGTAAVKSEVNAALANKLEAADLTTALADYYTKSDAYSKKQIDDIVAGIQGQYGETADAVAGNLKAHADEATENFARIDAKNDAQDQAIAANDAAIKLINNETTGLLVQAATTAQQKVNELKLGEVKTNADNIATITNRVNSIDDSIVAINSSIGTLTQKTDDNAAAIAAEVATREALAETVAGHTTKLSELAAADITINAAIEANTAKFANYSTTDEVTAAITAAVGGIDHSAMTNGIAQNAKDISDEIARATGEESRLAGLIAGNTSAIEANADNITALETLINSVIENDDGETLNSIKELAAWINDHTDGKDGILPAIQANTDAIAVLNGSAETAGSVQKIVNDAIAAIPATPVATANSVGVVKASAEVTVANDGTMGIGTVSTDKLVQGSETLVLLGGAAK